MTPEAVRDTLTRKERAGDWCIRLASANLSAEEQAQFNAWMAADEANEEAFDQALQVWQALHALGDTPELIGQRADALNALRRANRQRWTRDLFSVLQRPLAIAASIVLVLVSSLFLIVDRPRSYETGVGERRTFVLEDGSRISLDAETRVSVNLESERRELLLLSGRAKFDVAKDTARPFTVTAGKHTVVATGTAFSVEKLQGKVHVIVYEGHVALLPQTKTSAVELRRVVANAAPVVARVELGNELIASLEGPGSAIVKADVARTLAWEGGELSFDDEPLSSAVERFNRYEELKLVVGDQRAGDILVNGVFNAGDSDAFVEALATAFPVSVRHEGEAIVIRSHRE